MRWASMRCDSCHSGAYTNQGLTGAYGTASFPGHVATNGQDCAVCHKSAATSFTSWSGAGFVHTAANTNCVSCHNGTTATGLATPPHIPTGTIQCSGCHNNAPGTLLTSFTRRPAIRRRWGGRACGGGVDALRQLPQRRLYEPGSDGGLWDGELPRACGDERAGLRRLSQERGDELHELVGGRLRAHGGQHQLRELPNGTTATGWHAAAYSDRDDPVLGLPQQCAGDAADELHTAPGYPQAMGAAGHAVVASMRCDSCHSGAYTNQGLTGALGTASFAGHVATNGQDCAVCHKSAATSFTSWPGQASCTRRPTPIA
ncbi:hypothetical protein B1812_20780 [Methylocystis bryophila]|uniref:Uncharacterized protein n=2 Tax=Methylocystis bryophila TaxID=655015 RepID=A0A1W6MZV9_9HYPH|nr:hypothetical protein B1812_20780 [Methylocystis bryophila]